MVEGESQGGGREALHPCQAVPGKPQRAERAFLIDTSALQQEYELKQGGTEAHKPKAIIMMEEQKNTCKAVLR